MDRFRKILHSCQGVSQNIYIEDKKYSSTKSVIQRNKFDFFIFLIPKIKDPTTPKMSMNRFFLDRQDAILYITSIDQSV